eukprot:15131298-Alexandrium_andersonii.AAC.1
MCSRLLTWSSGWADLPHALMLLRAFGGTCVAFAVMQLRSPGPSGHSEMPHSDGAAVAEKPLPPPG